MGQLAFIPPEKVSGDGIVLGENHETVQIKKRDF
jgi:hypothetical protein